MKFFLCLLLLAAGAFAQTPPAATTTDPEVQEILALAKDQSALQNPALSPRERRLAYDAGGRAMLERGRAYLAKHASGPDRAEVVLALTGRAPQFLKAIDPRFDQEASVAYMTFDEDARRGHEKEVRTLLEGLRADSTATAAQRLQAGRSLTMRTISEADTAAELDHAQTQIEQLAAEGLEGRSLAVVQSRMFYPYAGLGLEAYAAYLDRLAQSPVAALHPFAQEAKERLDRARNGLGKFKFTAADGREVDLAKLKGKVVMVDFWATWCGPCIAELPHVLAAYAKYHDKGFEIIGVSFENSGLVTEADLPRLRSRNPDVKVDAPEEAARKIEAARVKMLKFTEERGMPWPQHFDGKYWQNELGVYFGIQAIPAVFLIDQEGRLVSTNMRGDKLESEVKRLLKL